MSDTGEGGSQGPPPSGGMIQCFGCGASVPDVEGPVHPYMDSAPGCWAAFGDVMAMEFGDFRCPECHRLTVDTYAVQHPGTPSRKTIQSVGGHLISLHLMLERGIDSVTATRALRRAVTRASMFSWLTPPSSQGPLTILDVRAVKDLDEHQLLVRRWAEATWEAWAEHHETVRAWAVLP